MFVTAFESWAPARCSLKILTIKTEGQTIQTKKAYGKVTKFKSKFSLILWCGLIKSIKSIHQWPFSLCSNLIGALNNWSSAFRFGYFYVLGL